MDEQMPEAIRDEAEQAKKTMDRSKDPVKGAGLEAAEGRHDDGMEEPEEPVTSVD